MVYAPIVISIQFTSSSLQFLFTDSYSFQSFVSTTPQVSRKNSLLVLQLRIKQVMI
jgi:hypothetical protein